MDITTFDASVRNLERSSRLEAENYFAAAEAAKDDLAGLSKLWPQGWPEGHETGIRDRIKKNTEMGNAHLRVADIALAGYVAPWTENAEWMGKHSNLVGAAYEHGRAKASDPAGMY